MPGASVYILQPFHRERLDPLLASREKSTLHSYFCFPRKKMTDLAILILKGALAGKHHEERLCFKLERIFYFYKSSVYLFIVERLKIKRLETRTDLWIQWGKEKV